MSCDNDYCIYNSGDNECILGEVFINNIGMCEACTMISLDKDFLASERQRQREEINRRYEAAD